MIVPAYGIHHLLHLFRPGCVMVAGEGSKPVPVGIAAGADLAGASARAAALAGVNPVGRNLFRGCHSALSPGPAIDGASWLVSLNSPSMISFETSRPR